MKILTVCQRGITRSHALAYLLKDVYQLDAVAIGWHSAGPELMRTLCDWADMVVVMEEYMRGYIPASFRHKVSVCEVGRDVWFRKPNAELLEKCDTWIKGSGILSEKPEQSAPPFVSCLCPTYRSPDTLETVIECFRRQDYPADRRELLILEDAQEIPSQSGDGWRLVSQPNRAASLSEKYNTLARMSRGSIIAVWEHDEFYAPDHLSRHVAAIQSAGSSLVLAKDPKVWVDCHGWPPQLDGAGGRFHASLVFTRTLLDAVGGWPDTKDRDFDLRLIAAFTARGTIVEPVGDPSYVFRWHGSGTWHAQHFMAGEDKTTWWDEAQKRTQPKPREKLTPRLDANAQQLMEWFSARKSAASST